MKEASELESQESHSQIMLILNLKCSLSNSDDTMLYQLKKNYIYKITGKFTY